MTFKLRDYQQKLVDSCIASLKGGHKKPLLVLPTGGGKTAIASELVRRSFCKNKSSIFICHRQELIYQTIRTYKKNNIEPAVILSGVKPDYSNPIQIASVNTLIKRLDKVTQPKVVFWDECQHCMSNTWLTVANAFPDAFHIGLTATPCRLDGKPLNLAFDDMIEVINTKQLIEQGYLSPYQYYAPSNIDTSELKVGSHGDYTQKSLMNASFNSSVVGDNIEHYRKLADGKRNIVFAVSRNHAAEITQRYREAGYTAEMLDGTMSRNTRETIVKKFTEGQISVLVNVDLFGEGFDLPAVEVVSLLRPTASTSLYLQQVGRGLRICEGKTSAIILDHVNNYKRHGLPDLVREWSLSDGLNKRKHSISSDIAIKRCPMCFFAHTPALKCPNCGYIYRADGKKIHEVAGELVLLGSEEYRQAEQKELIMADTYEDFIRIEKRRGYKRFWAEKQWLFKSGINLWSDMKGLQCIAKARGYGVGWVWVQLRNRR